MSISNIHNNTVVSQSQMALEAGNINLALHLVHDFVERIVTEPICTSMIFSSPDLDQLCLNIGRASLKRLGIQVNEVEKTNKNSPIIVCVVSRLQRSGGHSRLVQDFIRLQPNKEHLIISTEIGGPSDIDYYAKIFNSQNNVTFVRIPCVSYEDKLIWLQKKLINHKPEHIYLFNHHQDSVAVAALVPELNLNGSFIHHGDHHLCLGVHFKNLNHIDLHPMGYHYCRDELGIENKYLPLTFHDQGFVPEKPPRVANHSLITATVARSNKVEIPYYVNYIDIVPLLLKVTGGKHIHIGSLTPWALRSIRRSMKELNIPSDRFVYIKWTASVWKSLQELKVDVYLASFPYGAGLTLIEAMGAGLPVIMHQHMYSRVLSGLELAYPGAFSWSDPNNLLKHLAELTPENLEQEGLLARQQFENYHRQDLLVNFLENHTEFDLKVPDLNARYSIRKDEWVAWIESQITIRHIAYREIYRIFRRLRRIYSELMFKYNLKYEK